MIFAYAVSMSESSEIDTLIATISNCVIFVPGVGLKMTIAGSSSSSSVISPVMLKNNASIFRMVASPSAIPNSAIESISPS